MNICPNCNQQTVSKLCPACGIPTAHRIDAHFVSHEIRHSILHLESGLLYTIREMLVRPGITVRNYINGDRSRHYKPFGFLVITSLIYMILRYFLHFREMNADEFPGKNTKMLMEWISGNYSYANLIEIVMIALLLKLFFYYLRYNFFEYLVLLCYLSGIGMLICTFAMILTSLTEIVEFYSVGFIITLLAYVSWGIGQFAGGGFLNYCKAFFAYAIGMTVFFCSVIFIGLTMDLLNL